MSDTPAMIKMFIPTGGVTSPISHTTTMITPNQIGSKPTARITGKMMGSVRARDDRISINMPMMMKIMIIKARRR